MMYHVNLLLDDERRSASPVNAGMVLRMGGFAALAAMLLLIMMLFVESRDVETKVSDAQTKWEHLKPQHAEFLALRGSVNELRASARQIEACRLSRLALGTELALLQRGVPEDIQLTALRVNQFVGNQKVGASARSYEMRISGKVVSDTPKEVVDELIKYLSAPAFTGRVDSVTIPNNSFRKESVRGSAASDARTDWYFELVCRYRPRSFE